MPHQPAHVASLVLGASGYALLAPSWQTYLIGVGLMAAAHYLALRFRPGGRKSGDDNDLQ